MTIECTIKVSPKTLKILKKHKEETGVSYKFAVEQAVVEKYGIKKDE